MVFWLTCGLHILKTIVYSIWGSGEVQPFDTPKIAPKDVEDVEEMERLAAKE